jgi:hypothetical protein
VVGTIHTQNNGSSNRVIDSSSLFLSTGVPAVASWKVLEWKKELKFRGLIRCDVENAKIIDEHEQDVADETSVTSLSPDQTYRIQGRH